MVGNSQYDELGRVTRISSLDPSGGKMNDTAGNATLVVAYDRKGNQTHAKALDENDRPTLLKRLGFAENKMVYDDFGNVTESAFLDRSSRPTANQDGVYLIRTDYDEKGYVQEIRYYDTEKHTALSKEGYHKISYLEIDEQGNPLRWAYFGTEDEKATNVDGVHEFRATYNSRGFLESLAAFDRDRQPTILKNGYHGIRYEYDQKGQQFRRILLRSRRKAHMA